ncbi:membrane associated rhomboid family serine protease [Bosea sp. OAE752]
MERVGNALARLLRRYPRLRWLGIGFGVGGVFGLFFGGIGLTARGGGIGLWGWAVFGIIGALLANWLFQRRKEKLARSAAGRR